MKLKYTILQRIIIKFSVNIMPIITYLVLFDKVNTLIWKLLGVKVGKKSLIRRGTIINVPFMLTIGNYCNICGYLLSRGKIVIGNDVDFVHNVTISSQSHDLSSKHFDSIYKPVIIKDYCWCSIDGVILQDVTLGEGSVLAAGSVVTKDTKAWGVYTGIPAKIIKMRTKTSHELIER